MEKIKNYFQNNFSGIRGALLGATGLAVVFLIWFSFLGLLPFHNFSDLIFLSLLIGLFALYRPGWTFLLFLSVIPLENVILNPELSTFSLRPYQLVGLALILGLIIRKIIRRLDWMKIDFQWRDGLWLLMVLGVWISSAINHSGLKFPIIFSSFVAWFFLTRLFLININELKKIMPFFLSSALIVFVFALWQNILFLNQHFSFEVMPGRPNGSFTEPDWLGLFIILVLSALWGWRIMIIQNEERPKFFSSGIFFYWVLSIVVMIITVSRSAWLGAFMAWIVFTGGLLWQTKKSLYAMEKKKLFSFISETFLAVLISLGLVYFFHLTNFQLFNRLQSTGSGEQKITIACSEEAALPEIINNVSELADFHCQHINLEEITEFQERGAIIKEIYRQDPNANIRKIVWKKSLTALFQHPIWGIGWGKIGEMLGKDESGKSLNASNIFLEIWLGGGIIAGLAFLIFVLTVFWRLGVKVLFSDNFDEFVLALSIFSAWTGFIIFNLFNSGWLMGFVWVFFALISII